MAAKIAGIAVTVLLLVYGLTLILHISAHQDQYLWDFRTHREAGKIMASGANPYDADKLFPVGIGGRDEGQVDRGARMIYGILGG